MCLLNRRDLISNISKNKFAPAGFSVKIPQGHYGLAIFLNLHQAFSFHLPGIFVYKFKETKWKN